MRESNDSAVPCERHRVTVDARRALASALDDRFRTEEAIELYWALLEDTNDLAEQRGLVKSLAALYGRKGTFDRLLSRLKLRGREASDMRTATLLTSEAHRSMDDLGAARHGSRTAAGREPA